MAERDKMDVELEDVVEVKELLTSCGNSKTAILSSSAQKQTMLLDKVSQRCRIRNEYLRKFIGEFFGTFILVVFGDGTIAQMVLSRGKNGSIVTINLGWGLAVAMGVMVAHPISHGHINPAFSFARALQGMLSWKLLPVYLLGQYLGAFCGAATVFTAYYDAIIHYHKTEPMMAGLTGNQSVAVGNSDEWSMEVAGIFATYPREIPGGHTYLSYWNGLFDQILGTFLLVFMALVIIEERGIGLKGGPAAMFVGTVVTVLTTTLEFNCGAPLNPARDFGPRLFTAIAGWGSRPFTHHYWWWIPILGPHLGAIIAMIVFSVLIRPNL